MRMVATITRFFAAAWLVALVLTACGGSAAAPTATPTRGAKQPHHRIRRIGRRAGDARCFPNHACRP